MDLTVLIITKNSAITLERTLKSVFGWAQILVVDDSSTDKTVSIAYRYKSTVIRNSNKGFSAQRAFALTQVKTKWTLVLDCDEVLTDENRKEIERAVVSEKNDGYLLRFRNHLFGKKLNHGELHKKMVLFQTKKAFITQKEIHEQYEVNGTVGELHSEVLHYSYQNIFQIWTKFFRYSILQAKQYKKENKKYGLRELFLNPLHMFYARFIKDEGYKDGVVRIILDGAFAHMEFLSYFFIPFVKTQQRIGVDCGAYAVGDTVRSGIDRLIQGIYNNTPKDKDYYWFSFNKKTKHRLPTRYFSSVWLPVATLINRCDVFLGVAGNIPPLLRYSKIKKILFLYDFGFFSASDKYVSSAHKLQSQTVQSIKIADSIIFLHEEIYKEFIRLFPDFAYKASVIPSGADHLNTIEEKAVFIQEKKPLILSVGVIKPVKRIETTLSVVGDMYCIFAGPQEESYVKQLSIQKTQNIQFIQNFSDAQLKWLYKKADVLVNTSIHEGFCYPVLEALILGVPVVAFDLPLFREYKKYFPHLTLVPDEKEMRKLLEKKNFENQAPMFDHPYKWSSFVQKLDDVMKNGNLSSSAKEIKTVAFIVVLYKTAEAEKKRLEKEIKAMCLTKYHIYWIDNSSNGKGYACGINEGIRKGLSDKCDIFFALNPDISFCDIRGEDLLSAAQKFDVWGYAMKQGKEIYYGGEIDKWRLSGGLVETKPKTRYTAVDFVSGSVMGFTKEVVQSIGLWDESYFMYYEDVDYCMRSRKKGFVVGLDNDILYKHFEVSQYNKKKANWIAKSRWKFFWKYADAKQIMREIFRLPKTLLSK